MEKISGVSDLKERENKKYYKGKPFNVENFLGKGWAIIEQGKNIPDASSVEYEKVFLVKKEEVIKNKKNIFLGADSFWYLWKNKEKIPEKFKSKDEKNLIYVYFDGTILGSSNDSKFTLYLYYKKDKWEYGFSKLEKNRNSNEFSAVI